MTDSWAASTTRERRRQFVAQKGRLIFTAGLSLAALGLVSILIFSRLGSPVVGWMLATAIITSSGWVMRDVIDRGSGALWPAVGLEAERWTSDDLAKVKHGRVVDGLRFEHTDVDHILVCPAGVKAIETKTTSKSLDLADGLKNAQLARFVKDARAAARKIRLFLQTDFGCDVEPVLVLWGANVVAPKKGPVVIDGVTVLTGRDARAWSKTLRGCLLDARRIKTIFQALHRQREVRRAWSAARPA